MADRGTIGYDACTLAQEAPAILEKTHITCSGDAGGNEAVMGAKDTTEGSPSQPSLRMDGQGKFRFRWHVASGARTIQVSCKQAINTSPRPTLVVKANPDIGVNADVTETAGAGTGWVTIGPATINPTSAGAVWVELWCNYSGQIRITPCYWDHIQAT